MMRIYLQCNLRVLVRTFVFSVSVSFYDQTLESLHKGIHPELKFRQEEQLQNIARIRRPTTAFLLFFDHLNRYLAFERKKLQSIFSEGVMFIVWILK